MYNQVMSWYVQINSRPDRIVDDRAPMLIEEIECQRSFVLNQHWFPPLCPVLIMPDDLFRAEFASVNR